MKAYISVFWYSKQPNLFFFWGGLIFRYIDGLQSIPRESNDKDVVAMLVQLTIEANEESFVIVLQHGGNDVTCKRSIVECSYQLKKSYKISEKSFLLHHFGAFCPVGKQAKRTSFLNKYFAYLDKFYHRVHGVQEWATCIYQSLTWAFWLFEVGGDFDEFMFICCTSGDLFGLSSCDADGLDWTWLGDASAFCVVEVVLCWSWGEGAPITSPPASVRGLRSWSALLTGVAL